MIEENDSDPISDLWEESIGNEWWADEPLPDIPEESESPVSEPIADEEEQPQEEFAAEDYAPTPEADMGEQEDVTTPPVAESEQLQEETVQPAESVEVMDEPTQGQPQEEFSIEDYAPMPESPDMEPVDIPTPSRSQNQTLSLVQRGASAQPSDMEGEETNLAGDTQQGGQFRVQVSFDNAESLADSLAQQLGPQMEQMSESLFAAADREITNMATRLDRYNR